KGGHKTFLHTPLPITSPLYGTLSNLPGLNLHTGNDLVTLGFDFKHVFKSMSHSTIYLNNPDTFPNRILYSKLFLCWNVSQQWMMHQLISP
ncbi:hypothetical protein PAXRUDRAFT_155506, partial [Paxillus rubicundulus Ve08.2h10]